MLNLLRIGEHAGSGVPDIYAAWEDKGWQPPVIEEQYNPDRTILTLPMVENRRTKTSAKTSAKLAQNKKETSAKTSRKNTADRMVALMKKNPSISIDEMAEKLNLSSGGIRYHTKKLRDANRIRRVGGTHGGHWEVL